MVVQNKSAPWRPEFLTALRVLGKRLWAIMASETSKAEDEEVVDMAMFGRELRRRQAAAGPIAMPRNSGKRRTKSKRALLKAIKEAGGKW